MSPSQHSMATRRRCRQGHFIRDEAQEYIDASGGPRYPVSAISLHIIAPCAPSSTSSNTRTQLSLRKPQKSLPTTVACADGLGHAFLVTAGPGHEAALKLAHNIVSAGEPTRFLIARPELPRYARALRSVAANGSAAFARYLIETAPCFAVYEYRNAVARDPESLAKARRGLNPRSKNGGPTSSLPRRNVVARPWRGPRARLFKRVREILRPAWNSAHLDR